MKIIQKILNTEEISYSSNLNVENLKKKVKALFEQKTLRLAGKLTSENEFTAYDKFNVVGWDMPNLKRKSAYLKGKITQEKKGTLIKLKVNPNFVLPAFAMLTTLIGIVLTLIALSNTEADEFSQIIGPIFIAVGIIYYPLSTFFRNRLRNRIVEHLDLSKV